MMRYLVGFMLVAAVAVPGRAAGEVIEVAGASTSTTTTTLAGTTTTTTLPAACADPFSFTALGCRLGLLNDQVTASRDVDPVRTRLANTLRLANTRAQQAESRCAQGNKRSAKSLLKKAARRLIAFGHILRTANVADSAADPLITSAGSLNNAMRSFRGALVCPPPA